MKTDTDLDIRDVQNTESIFKMKIDKVGIKNLQYPLVVLDKKYHVQRTIANINIFVDLPSEKRGTHMSRFIEVMNRFVKRAFCVDVMDEFVSDIKETLCAKEVSIELSYPFFVEKTAPVSKKTSLLDYSCRMIYNNSKEKIERFIEVKVPITTLCPCSKEISEYGAHNQRGVVTLLVKHNSFIWIEDLILLIENEASCGIYPLLKRVDEKFVTEKAYTNPWFVEDIVRKIAEILKKNGRISGFRLECENYESIHNHNAYAEIEWNL